jgi:hypothetical protein
MLAAGLTVAMLITGSEARPVGAAYAAPRTLAMPASTSVSKQVAALKKQYTSKVGPALAQAALTGSESDADSALGAYESWMQKVTAARKSVRNKLNALRARATELATNVYYQALRTIGTDCPSNPTLQLYDSSQGSQFGISGWVVNALQVDKFVAFMARHRAKLFITESPLDSGESAAFRPCRPTGFKFEGLSYIEIDGDVTITQTYSGEMCGPDPYAAPWKISITETIVDPEDSETRTDIVPVTLNPNSWVESAPDGVPYYGAFHINTDASPPQMQMRVTPLQDYAEAGGTSLADLVEACQ